MTGQKVGTLAALLMCGALAMPVMAQTDAGGGNAPTTQPTNRGGRNFDPSAFRQRMLDALKTRLGATDDEFAAIQPKLEKVMQLQRDANGGGMRGMLGGGNRQGRNRNGGNGGDNGAAPAAATVAGQEQSAVQKASADLQTTLDDKDAKPDDIKAKLDAFRDAKTKAKADLAAAQTDLQSVLTQRQEAVLVMMGLLN